MANRIPIHPAPALPPLRQARIATAHGVAATLAPTSARLTRLALTLVALALPALGLAYADTVPRTGAARARQAAAPETPSHGAAASILPATAPARQATLLPGGRP